MITTGTGYGQAVARPEAGELLGRLAAARAGGDPDGCVGAERAVIVHFLPVAAGIASRFRGRGVDVDDLEQVARIGLVKAVRRWRSPGGFLQYARPTIEGEIRRYLRDHGSAIRIPRSLYEREPSVVSVTVRLRQLLGREPSVAEVAADAGVSVGIVRDVRAARGRCRPLSVDGDVSVDGDALMASLARLASLAAAGALDGVDARMELRAAIADLTEHERDIVALRFIWGQSQAEIAATLGVSQMHVSRSLRATLEKLREALREPDRIRDRTRDHQRVAS